jgi:uncharacterized damage-inducible protein DinB
MHDSGEKATAADAFARGPDRLCAAIAGLGETDLDLSLGSGSWTIRQTVHHVVDGDDIWKVIVKAALGEPSRVLDLQWYWDVQQDVWTGTWAYARRPLEPSLELLRASRRHVLQLLECTPDAWKRSVTMRWPSGEEERVTVGAIVEMQADHVAQHVEDIQAIREVHGV